MNFKIFWAKHGTKVLTGVSIVSHVASPVLAVLDDREYQREITAAAEAKEEAYMAAEDTTGLSKDLTRKENAIIFAKTHWRSGSCMLLGVAADCVNLAKTEKALANMATALSSALASRSLLEKTVKEHVGEAQYEEIKAKIVGNDVKTAVNEPKNAEILANHPSKAVIGDGNHILFVDTHSGKTFIGTMDQIRQIQADFARILDPYDGTPILEIEWYNRLTMIDPNIEIPGWIFDEGTRLGWNYEHSFDGSPRFDLMITPVPLPDGSIATGLTIPPVEAVYA